MPGSDGRFMAGGLAFHRLKFAEVTALVVIVAVAVRRPLALALAGLGFVSVLVFPAARASAGALVLALSLTVRPRWLSAALIVGAIALVGLTPGLRERFLSSTTSSGSGERAAILQSGLDAVAAHPLTGVGLGRFKPSLFARADAPPELLDNAGKSHNQFLSLAAEGGVGHALLFALLLGWVALRLLRARPSKARTAGLAALAFFVLLCLVHDPMFHAVMVQGTALLLGGAVGLGVRQQEPDEREAQLRRALQVQAAGDAGAQKPGGA
ncbi:MAG: O-antigen ligase family protein [Myxococcaceae bacterium]|nr:O-antigen ligase family protein [Myxococcaceae bacterium]